MASWERFLGAMSWLHFQGASASISRMNRHYFSHDRAAIGVRIVRRSPSFHRRGDSPTFALRSRLGRDHGVLPRCVCAVGSRSK